MIGSPASPNTSIDLVAVLFFSIVQDANHVVGFPLSFSQSARAVHSSLVWAVCRALAPRNIASVVQFSLGDQRFGSQQGNLDGFWCRLLGQGQGLLDSFHSPLPVC